MENNTRDFRLHGVARLTLDDERWSGLVEFWASQRVSERGEVETSGWIVAPASDLRRALTLHPWAVLEVGRDRVLRIHFWSAEGLFSSEESGPQQH